jgi:hypothetical protein
VPRISAASTAADDLQSLEALATPFVRIEQNDDGNGLVIVSLCGFTLFCFDSHFPFSTFILCSQLRSVRNHRLERIFAAQYRRQLDSVIGVWRDYVRLHRLWVVARDCDEHGRMQHALDTWRRFIFKIHIESDSMSLHFEF